VVSIKSTLGHVMLNLYFCIRWDLWVMSSTPVCSRHETSTHNFLCLGGTGAVFIKSVLGHVTLNLYFCIQWDLQVTKCIMVRLWHEMLMHYFSCSGGLGAILEKGRRDTLCRTCVFSSCGICR
jgi:hypothetical protein